MDPYSAFREQASEPDPYTAFRRPKVNQLAQSSDASDGPINPNEGEARWWNHAQTYGGRTISGESVNHDNLLTSSTCFACTKAIAETIAGLSKEIYSWTAKTRELARESDPYFLLAESPNEEIDPYTFHELCATRVVNRGNFYAEIQRDESDRVVGLWPIHPSRVKPLRDSDKKLFWEITHDYDGMADYQDPAWRKENLSYISRRNMLNIVGFGSRNGITSAGMLFQAEEIGLDMAALRYGADFYSQGTVPAGFVTHPEFIQDDATRRIFREDINGIHSKERHKLGILWNGATYGHIGIEPEKAQVLQSRKNSRKTLCMMYGTPPQIIGDMEDSKYATADAAIRHWVMITISNLARRIEQAYENQILYKRDFYYNKRRMVSQFGENYIFEFVLAGLLRGDPVTQARTMKVYRDGGFLDTNEGRQQIGYDPIEGPEGKYRIIPGGFARLDKIDNQGTRTKSNKNTSDKKSNESDKDSKALNEQPFNRDRIIEMILESGLARGNRPDAQARGHNPSTEDQEQKESIRSARDEMVETCLRNVHGITLTQVSRWEMTDRNKVTAAMPDFWTKQRGRLEKSLSPANKLAVLVGDPDTLANEIGEQFHAAFSALDYHDVFDRDRLSAILEDCIKETKSCS